MSQKDYRIFTNLTSEEGRKKSAIPAHTVPVLYIKCGYTWHSFRSTNQARYHYWASKIARSFPGSTSGKEPACQCWRCQRCRFRRSPEGGRGSPSSTLAWRIPWTEEPGGPWSTVSKSLTRLKWLSMHVSQQDIMSGLVYKYL